ncbi:MAG: peptidase, partial [Thermodesulfobacteriota bacterium]
TFCLGMKVKDGLIGVADTRITTGSECITARKVTIHQHRQHSMFLMTSGLRSVRDKAITYFQEVIEESDEDFDKLHKAVNAFGEQVRRALREDKDSLEEGGFNFNLYALVGGQLEHDREHKLYLLYPQGNWVEVSQGSPYYIIGNSGYGKPLLDRVLRYESPMHFALKTGFLAFDATRTSSNDVEYPLDIVIYCRDSFNIIEHRFQKDDLQEVSFWWQERIADSVRELPDEWVEVVFSKLQQALSEKISL